MKIGGEKVEVVENFEYLGTVIDNQLSFSDNVNLITKKPNRDFIILENLGHPMLTKKFFSMCIGI